MQEEGDCAKLQYVQSMEISGDVMWVVDVGRRNIFTAAPDNSCPPKLVRIDVRTRVVLSTYDFPTSAASHTASFLNDIVVDAANDRAFICARHRGPPSSRPPSSSRPLEPALGLPPTKAPASHARS